MVRKSNKKGKPKKILSTKNWSKKEPEKQRECMRHASPSTCACLMYTLEVCVLKTFVYLWGSKPK